MSSFTEALVLTPDGVLWRVERAFFYEVGAKGSGLKVEVPAGYRSDLGSIPRPLWWLVSPHEPNAAAPYVLHDRLYDKPDFSRLMSDVILYEALRVMGNARWKAALIFLGVRLGGASRYHVAQATTWERET